MCPHERAAACPDLREGAAAATCSNPRNVQAPEGGTLIGVAAPGSRQQPRSVADKAPQSLADASALRAERSASQRSELLELRAGGRSVRETLPSLLTHLAFL